MTTKRQFKYQLASLLRKRETESDELRHQLAEVQTRVDTAAGELEAVRAMIEQTESRLRTDGQEGAAIEPDLQARLRVYLKMQRVEEETKKENLQKVEQERDEVSEKLRTVREGIKALEKHREGRRIDFDTEWERRDQAAADELWLLRRSAKRQ
jgi:flagellar export protein FliJ